MGSSITQWLVGFSERIGAGDIPGAADMFAPDGIWRDLVGFTWDIQSIEGSSAIRRLLADHLTAFAETRWEIDSFSNADGTEGFIRFETSLGRGRGYVRLAGEKCTTLLTALDELKGHEEARAKRRPISFTANAQGNWLDNIKEEQRRLGRDEQPYVLIVGSGQGGLALAARLRQLNVPTIVVDRNANPGDQWRQRYASLSLHDPVWYDHMPYLPFPDTWPVFTPKDKIADWLESYARLMELNIWGSTEMTGARYDDATGTWKVELRRDGEAITLQLAHLVLAVGNAGKPRLPEFEGMTDFKGIQRHSSAHPGGSELAGKHVAVIGSNNSAHDICADLVDHGATVTMVQRSSTLVIRQETFVRLCISGFYSEEAVAAGLTTERADLLVASIPMRLIPAFNRPIVAEIKRQDAQFYQALEDVGFMLDFGEDEAGITGKYLRSASGYYIDVGASELIANGTVRLRSNVGVQRIVSDGILLTDGSHLAADAIIYATGFDSMDQVVGNLISPEIAANVGKVWGYGSDTKGDPGPWEGELRNMWKPTAQEGLWFQGGNLAQSRYYSAFLALQLKARMEGIALPPYRPG